MPRSSQSYHYRQPLEAVVPRPEQRYHLAATALTTFQWVTSKLTWEGQPHGHKPKIHEQWQGTVLIGEPPAPQWTRKSKEHWQI